MLITLGVVNINAQGISRNIIEAHNVNNTKFEMVQKIYGEDTSYFATVVFQNMKYSTISDIEIIVFNEAEVFLEFIDAIKDVAGREPSSDYEYTTKNKCWIFTSKYGVVINSPEGKYTMVNRKMFLKKYDSIRSMSKYLL
jgi:hypothetical protein